MESNRAYRVLATLLVLALGMGIRISVSQEAEWREQQAKEQRLTQQEEQRRSAAEAVRAFSEQDENLQFAADSDNVKTIEEPGDLGFRVPASWEEGVQLNGKSIEFKNPYRDGFFDVCLYEDLCLTCTSAEDVVTQALNELRSLSLDEESPQRGTLGGAVWLRYAVHTDSKGSEFIPSTRSYGYLELIMSGHDVYSVTYLCPGEEYTREAQQEVFRILNSISGPEDEPLFLEDGQENTMPKDDERGDGGTQADDEDSMREFLGSFGTYQSHQVKGTDNEVVDVPTGALGSGMAFPSLIEISYQGTGVFVARLHSDADDEYRTLLEHSGPYHGFITNMGDTLTTFMSREIDIAAEGAWSITFSPLTAVDPLENGGGYEGDFVAYFDEQAMSKLHITHTGEGAFSVLAAGMTGTKRLVDTEGPVDETVTWDDPHTLFVITSEGPWCIDW